MLIRMMVRKLSFFSCLMVALTLPALAQQPEEVGVCARVKIKISQDVAITRTAFRATLEISNAPENVDLENVAVTLQITNDADVPSNDVFGIKPPDLTGISDVDGSGTIVHGSTAKAVWIIIPTRDAAPDADTTYWVGGEVAYKQADANVKIPLLPVKITVRPDPLLFLDYFLVREVYSDDPFTPQVEPAEPFPLGLLMVNRGRGVARNVRITTSQPEIIENEKGLLIDFKIIGTQVNADEISPSLTVNLGEIGAGQTSAVRWMMVCSLQGKFIEYAATFEHVDSLGDPRLSIIDSVNIHELTHAVRVENPDDYKPDFLVNDTPPENEEDNPEHLPNILYNSDGTTAPVGLGLFPQISGTLAPGQLSVQMTANVPGGFVYIKANDVGQEQYRLMRVVRSDGREIRMGDNAWTTHRTYRYVGQAPYREHKVHIFDEDSTGSYTLFYEQVAGSGVSPGAAKLSEDGDEVTLGDNQEVIVTAVFPDGFYVQAAGSAAGIKVLWNGTISVGDRVVLHGVLGTSDEFERYIQADSVNVVGTGSISPFALRNKDVGGCDSLYNPATGAGQRGIEDCAGANNIGLLIKVTGRVTAVGSNYFYIDDGTHARDCTIYRGVRIESGNLTRPGRGEFVQVTGISTILRGGDRVFRKVRPRIQSDIGIVSSP